MTNQQQEYLEFAKKLAYEAGEVMRRSFTGEIEWQTKADGTPITKADIDINHTVIEAIKQAFPNDEIIGEEESTTEYGMGRMWFCDPIDGTGAFIWGIPTAMFSLALVVDGRPELGVAYEPMTDRLYWAVRGAGAYCNGRRLQVNTQSLHEGIVAVTSSHWRISRKVSYIERMLDQRISLAGFSGAVAKSLRIAEGRFVGYIEEVVNAYDMAAAHVIIEEAGGKITGLDGSPLDYSRPFKGAIVSNALVHDELVAFV